MNYESPSPFHPSLHPSSFILCFFLGQCQVHIVPAVANENFTTGRIGARLFFAPEPWVVGFRAQRFSASIFVFYFKGNCAKKASSSFANVSCQEKGADVLSDAVVEIRIPALDLVFDRFPANEDV